ncbi:MAG: sodium-dependent transporter [Deltaproteobacteria bacterium]|nr:sodium-dependent transporter [Deltaproteobacteria bacterium]MBN2673395.1 sodium-dependent transporter [Deltaproteobacteria bacterium]
MTVQRDTWDSKLGFIMAASGSAVGLGNLWKFPYITWENNGGAFVLVYLGAVFFLGLPIMMGEIFVGRTAQLSGAPAYKKLGGKGWSKLGYLGAAAGGIILSYYMVIAGWSLYSFGQCVGWSFSGYPESFDGPAAFGKFTQNGWLQIALTAGFTLMNGAIILRGIGRGIEKATKIMMPILVLIMLYLVATALFMDGRNEALSTIFSADFAAMEPKGYLEAVGQAFFSLSLGLGAMVAYGSYMKKNDSITHSALWVVSLDTLFALLACVVMFTIIFSVPDLQAKVSAGEVGTVGMLFIALPELFYTVMPGGMVVAPLFFILVGFAALSSTLSLGEVVASIMIDRRGWNRKKAVLITASVVFVGSIFAALSLGANKTLSGISFDGVPIMQIIFSTKKGVLSLLDHLACNWMLPLGGLGTTLFVGWYLKNDFILKELGIKQSNVVFNLWIWCLRVVAPAAIIALIIAVAMGKDFS